MSLSNSRASYEDCFKLLDAALDEPRGTRVEILSGPRAATHFRMRIHQARQIDRSENAKIYPDPDHHLHNRSVYDILVLRIEDGPPCWLYLDKQKVDLGVIEPIPEGYQIAPTAPVLRLEYQPIDQPTSSLPSIRRR